MSAGYGTVGIRVDLTLKEFLDNHQQMTGLPQSVCSKRIGKSDRKVHAFSSITILLISERGCRCSTIDAHLIENLCRTSAAPSILRHDSSTITSDSLRARSRNRSICCKGDELPRGVSRVDHERRGQALLFDPREVVVQI